MSLRVFAVSLRFAGLAAAAVIFAAAARAADNTRYISITGKNANPCTLAQPCKTLQRGVAMTPAGGELRILNSGFYGNNATIRKSLTITGNGNTVFLGSTLTIKNASAVVALRGLVLDGQGSITEGIAVVAAAAVHIERCVIHGFTSHGINATAANADVFVRGSHSRDNGARGLTGVSRLLVDSSNFDNNSSSGVLIEGGGIAAISRSTASGNGSHGIAVGSGAFVNVVSTTVARNGNGASGFFTGGTLTVESSAAHGNDSGLRVFSAGIARISNSSFTDNVTGIINANTVETRGNNTVRGNTTDFAGNALTPIGGD